MARDGEGGLEYVGLAETFVRVLEGRYAEQARHDFARYVRTTLLHNMRVGGRFNAPGEFGALYTASDEATAWHELAARYRREGIPGLPPTMGMIRVLVTSGRFVDLADASVRADWGVELHTITAMRPTLREEAQCHEVGRHVRAVADFLRAPSARAAGENIPLFVDGRPDAELAMELWSTESRRATPEPLRQRAAEEWD